MHYSCIIWHILRPNKSFDFQPIKHSKPFTHLCLCRLDLILQACNHSFELRYFPLGGTELITILVCLSSHLVKLPAETRQEEQICAISNYQV